MSQLIRDARALQFNCQRRCYRQARHQAQTHQHDRASYRADPPVERQPPTYLPLTAPRAFIRRAPCERATWHKSNRTTPMALRQLSVVAVIRSRHDCRAAVGHGIVITSAAFKGREAGAYMRGTQLRSSVRVRRRSRSTPASEADDKGSGSSRSSPADMLGSADAARAP